MAENEPAETNVRVSAGSGVVRPPAGVRSAPLHGGYPLACAGEVLALVPPLASARPEQDQGLRCLVGPLEPALLGPFGRTGVRGGIRVTYSNVFELVLLESAASRVAVPEFPRDAHVGLSTAEGSVSDHTSTEGTTL